MSKRMHLAPVEYEAIGNLVNAYVNASKGDPTAYYWFALMRLLKLMRKRALAKRESSRKKYDELIRKFYEEE